jgi:hypothetical protein
MGIFQAGWFILVPEIPNKGVYQVFTTFDLRVFLGWSQGYLWF